MNTAISSNQAGSATPRASVVISTKSRKEDLRVALRGCTQQTGFASGQVEVLVIDDGSTDGSAELVRSEFPEVKLLRFETSEGYIIQRNRGVELSRSPIVIIIDDDATAQRGTSPQSPDGGSSVEATLYASHLWTQ